MALVSAAELNGIEREVGPKTDEGLFQIQRSSNAIRVGAGFTGGVPTIVGTVPGRVQYIGKMNQSERQVMGVTRDDADFMITLKAFTDVRNSDVLLETAQAWLANKRYLPGQRVTPATDNGRTYLARQAGSSAATEPTWPLTLAGTVADGGQLWECLGLYRAFQVIEVMGSSTFGDFIARRVLCTERKL